MERAKRVEKDNKALVEERDELGYVPLSETGSELLFEIFSQCYERASTLVTSKLPFNEWTEIFGSERLTGALLDRLTHHVHILEMNEGSAHIRVEIQHKDPFLSGPGRDRGRTDRRE